MKSSMMTPARTRAQALDHVSVSGVLSPQNPTGRFGQITRPHTSEHRLEASQAYQIYEFKALTGRLQVSIESDGPVLPALMLYVKSAGRTLGKAPEAEPITQAEKVSDRQSTLWIDGLGQGTYYLVIDRNSAVQAALSYRLTIEVNPRIYAIAEREPNNNPTQAHNIGGKANVPIVGTRHMQGKLGPNDTTDYWQFTLTKPSRLGAGLKLEQANAQASLEILDATRAPLKTATTVQGAIALSFSRLPAGTYYARIRRTGSSNTNYDFSLEGIPVYAAHFIVKMHRLQAIDDFETFKLGGRRQADFYYQVSANGNQVITSPVFANNNRKTFNPTHPSLQGWAIHEVNLEQPIIQFSIALYEHDRRTDDHADINPHNSLKNLVLNYNTLTGEVFGLGIDVHQEGQVIRAQGKSSPRAEIMFEVSYETLHYSEG